MISINSLLMLGLLAAIILFWIETLRMREFVIKLCKKVCMESALQLLDQTVSLISIRLKCSTNRWPYIHRVYQFEVSSNGADRLLGYIILTGNIVKMIQIDSSDGKTTLYPYNQDVIH